ncbi:MAG: Re/Si-specific NAD(P)(+) transhydrogenase subunit alpha [Alphaproteobacteria bacterium]
MKIAVPKEIRDGERRVAMSPEVVKKFVAKGAELVVQSGAGEAAAIPDKVFEEAGALIAPDAAAVYGEADLVFKVQRPMTQGEGGPEELDLMPAETVLIGLLAPLANRAQVEDYARRGITALAMELIPRISRAQGMDALSSQSTIAGYKAVLDAASEFNRLMPMMMTAAGTIVPAKVLVLGAGVAGLQAIATSKRLGGVVSVFDVRPAVKEQVESLGAKFVGVEGAEGAETEGGYAREMDEEYKRRQAVLIHETLKKTDIAIAAALIPGKPAPLLITEEMVGDMRAGSVIVDLAVEAGGNCALTEKDRVVERDGVKIVGYANVPSRVPIDASAFYAKNLYNLIAPMIDEETKSLKIDWEDEIIKGALLTRGGAVVNDAFNSGGG